MGFCAKNHMKKKKFALAAVGLIAVTLWFFHDQIDTPWSSSSVSIRNTLNSTNELRNSINVADISAVLHSTDSQNSQRSAAVRSKRGGEFAGATNWKSIVSERDIQLSIQRLASSSEPDDWYRAGTLHRICLATAAIPEKMITEAVKQAALTEQQSKEIINVHAESRDRCGNEIAPPYVSGLLARAKLNGSKLANAPRLNQTSSQEGLTQDELDKLKPVLQDEQLRSAWIVDNVDRLASMIGTSSRYADLSKSQIEIALFESLCRAGDDCGPNSIYHASLCAVSTYKLCGSTSIEKTIAAASNPISKMRLDTFVADLNDAMNMGNLESLGFYIKKQK
jgi:hypothetical protein